MNLWHPDPVPVVSVILCAGQASRMGAPKALLSWRGKPLLEYAVLAAYGSGVERCGVVVGCHLEELLPLVRRVGATPILNPGWELGIGSSIKAGVGWARRHPDRPALLVQLADQPRVDSRSLKRILFAHRARPGWTVSACYGDGPGVPALFPAAAQESLLGLDDSEGAKRVLLRSRELIRVDLPEAAEDIDTPGQFARLVIPRTTRS